MKPACNATHVPKINLPAPIVFMVHGTFACGASWTKPDSAISIALREHLGESLIQSIEWSGRNTFQARQEAGTKIVNALISARADAPVALVCHSHGGSAVAYAMKNNPHAFRNVRAIVCLATPFFGFSVRPGFQSLLFGVIVGCGFITFQLALALSVIFGSSLSPRFDDTPFWVAAIGALLLSLLFFIARYFWKKRSRLYSSFQATINKAREWDTSQVNLSHALFIRSMGDEVGLSLGTLQLFSTILNKVINAIALSIAGVTVRLRSWTKTLGGKLKFATVILPFITISALPAGLAATFGYDPKYWIDALNPWSSGITFFEPEFGFADHSARAIYALVLFAVAGLHILVSLFSFFMILAIFLSWITTGAFGCLSFRLAIGTQWAVEPTPEGKHTFLNAGWNRDLALLENDRIGLQHSEPYSASAVIHEVANYIASRFER